MKTYRIAFDCDYGHEVAIVHAYDKTEARKRFFINAKRRFSVVKNISIEEIDLSKLWWL